MMTYTDEFLTSQHTKYLQHEIFHSLQQPIQLA
jgi:hypothetical protein